MFRLILVGMVMAIHLSGCAPTKVMFGVSEPNLAEIKPGSQRSDAEKVLGKRLWHVGVADGLTYDIYQFESEQPTRPMIGVGVLFADIITLGELELSVHPQDLTPAKQVAVAYDVQGRVDFVSKPWPVEAVGPCRRQRSLLPADSGVPATVRPGSISGSSGSRENVSKLDVDVWGIPRWMMVVSIDGNEFKGNVIELPPGHHEIIYHGRPATVELLPGRRYRLGREHFFGYKKANSFYFIEDVDSREILHCVPPYYGDDYWKYDP